jgi:hypothetical protein
VRLTAEEKEPMSGCKTGCDSEQKGVEDAEEKGTGERKGDESDET